MLWKRDVIDVLYQKRDSTMLLKSISVWIIALVFLGATSIGSNSDALADDLKVDLELFNLDELEQVPDMVDVRSCSYALMQHDKDRWDSKYPFAFFQPIIDSPYPTSAYISVSGGFIALEEIAAGSSNNGFNLSPYQLYRSFDGEYLVFLDLVLGEEVADIIEIESGVITVVATGKKPFKVRVIGAKGC
jgi:hypothetical protein